MSEFAARIRRVRMKQGGADVHIIQRGADEDWRGEVVRNARMLAEHASEAAPLVGYLVIGLYADGATSTGFRHDPARCPIPRALMPSWVAEVVRREMITGPEAEGVFNTMFQWVE